MDRISSIIIGYSTKLQYWLLFAFILLNLKTFCSFRGNHFKIIDENHFTCPEIAFLVYFSAPPFNLVSQALKGHVSDLEQFRSCWPWIKPRNQNTCQLKHSKITFFKFIHTSRSPSRKFFVFFINRSWIQVRMRFKFDSKKWSAIENFTNSLMEKQSSYVDHYKNVCDALSRQKQCMDIAFNVQILRSKSLSKYFWILILNRNHQTQQQQWCYETNFKQSHYCCASFQ